MPRLNFFFSTSKGKRAVCNHLVWRIRTRKQRWPQSAISPFGPGKSQWLSGDRYGNHSYNSMLCQSDVSDFIPWLQKGLGTRPLEAYMAASFW